MCSVVKRDGWIEPLELAAAKSLKHAKENLATESIRSFLEGDLCSNLSSCQIIDDKSYLVLYHRVEFSTLT